MRQDKQQSQDTKRIEKSQQLVFPLDMELQIPQDAPVRLLGEILDQMDFGSLERAEKRGAQRKIPGRILFGLLVFGQMNGRYSSRELEECCRYDVQYRWLLESCYAPDHCMLSRSRGEVLPEIAGELFGQLMRYLNEQGELDYQYMFVDGTKEEACANRYSSVWRGSVEKRLRSLREKASLLLAAGNAPVELDTVRRAVAEQEAVCRERGIEMVSGKGKRKSSEQKSGKHCGRFCPNGRSTRPISPLWGIAETAIPRQITTPPLCG